MKKKLHSLKKICSFFLLLTISIVFSGCLQQNKNALPYKMTLEVWGVFDDSEFFQEINEKYKKLNPQIQEIKYRKISANSVEYENELFDAIASGKGPDIFFFHNTWLEKHGEKVATKEDSKTYLGTFKENFVDVALADFVKNGEIYAMPLYCDTLALYYNKELFNQAGITAAPQSWNDLVNVSNQITQLDSFGNILRSGVALGRSKDPGGINRAADILSLLMMQSGNKMIENGVSTIQNNIGTKMLDFYTQFSSPDSPSYSWNPKMEYSIDSFRYGKTAMMINYSYWRDRLKKMDPKLKFEVVAVPQFDQNNKVNYANYWGLAVAKTKMLYDPAKSDAKVSYTEKDRRAESWKYITYLTTNAGKSADFDPTENYLTRSGKPPARRDLIEKLANDPDWKVFAAGALTARSWPQPDSNAVNDILMEAIDDVVSGRMESFESLSSAANRINALTLKNNQTSQ